MKKEENFKAENTFNMKCQQHNYQPLRDESLFSQVIDFFLTHAHPKFVYKLDINNHKTVSTEKDMNRSNLFN